MCTKKKKEVVYELGFNILSKCLVIGRNNLINPFIIEWAYYENFLSKRMGSRPFSLKTKAVAAVLRFFTSLSQAYKIFHSSSLFERLLGFTSLCCKWFPSFLDRFPVADVSWASPNNAFYHESANVFLFRFSHLETSSIYQLKDWIWIFVCIFSKLFRCCINHFHPISFIYLIKNYSRFNEHLSSLSALTAHSKIRINYEHKLVLMKGMGALSIYT